VIGQAFTRFTVIEEAGYGKHRQRLVKCRCSCGNEKVIDVNKLKSGHTKSCGCFRIEVSKLIGELSGL
jgi:hypothetical protein